MMRSVSCFSFTNLRECLTRVAHLFTHCTYIDLLLNTYTHCFSMSDLSHFRIISCFSGGNLSDKAL